MLSPDAADASDHEGAARAIAAGLAKGHSKEKPGYWLHTGGTGILTFTDSENGWLGKWTEKQYNDVSGVEELTHLPDVAFHRNVDKIVLEAGIDCADRVKTVIVCPPTIYGKLNLYLLCYFLSSSDQLTPISIETQATAAAQSASALAKRTSWRRRS